MKAQWVRLASGSRLRSSRGFTLVEVLIAIFISAIIAGAIYSVYDTFYRHTTTQDLVLEAQQNARVGINLMEREFINAGYNAGTADILTTATSTSAQFLYSEPTGSTDLLRVTYNYDSATKTLLRQEDNITTGATGAVNPLVPDVASLIITYYDENGLSIPTPIADQATRNTVKYVDITITTETKNIPPGALAKKSFTLQTHLRLRSIGIGLSSSASGDDTPPAAPSGLQVREVANPAGTGGGTCGKLKVKFTGSPDGDVSGHKIYYGTALNSYDGVINVPIGALSGADYSCTKAGNVYECVIAPATPALAPTLSFDYGTSLHAPASAVIYYFAVRGYDNSLNLSDYSNAAYGDSSTATIATSNTVFDSGVDDSTVNPGKPGAVTNFTSVDGTADGSLNLSWTAYPTASNPGVTELVIYRSTSPFTYPIDPSKEIAAVTSPATTSAYTDPGLTGCLQYYYAVAPVNCDPSLVSIDAGDTADEQFSASNYGVAYGDGAESGVDSPAGADTYPPDITPPDAPLLLKRNGEIVVGYKRVYMGVTNPGDTDFSHTLVYYNTTGPAPTVDTTLGSATYGDISGGKPVPDSNAGVPGKLTGAGRYIGYVHDNEQVADNSFYEGISAMHVPALTGTQYYYTAVAYDRCGNPSVATGNTPALNTLCGDGSAGLPEWGPPTAVPPINPLVQGCYSNDYNYTVNFNSRNINAVAAPMTVTWGDNADLLSIPDVAGYRVYRSPSSPFDTSLVPSDLNSVRCDSSPATTCFLGFIPVGTVNSLADAYGLTDAGATKYSYGIVTTDCAYQERWIPYLETDYKFNTSLWTVYNGAEGIGITPGMIDRDEKLAVADDSHREVLTGVTLDNSAGTGTGAATPATTFKHNTVTLFLENTANGPQTLDGSVASTFYWVNSGARLTNVAIGGGRSNMGVFNVSVPSSSNFTNAGTYTRRATTALGGITLPANTRNIPMVLTFTDTSGDPVDMRGDQVQIRLIVINNSTNTSGKPVCYAYATVLKTNGPTTISFGPSVNSVTQNNPSAPTFVYAVPGSTGFNTVPTDGSTYGSIAAKGNLPVVITAYITGNTLYEPTRSVVPVSSATLYYVETALTVGAAPSSGYTAVAMAHPSGNTWTGTIPAMTGGVGRRFWFYIVAVDSDGNYDRAPEPADGAYTYDQKPFGVCDVTPKSPTGLTLYSVAAGNAAFTWPRVTQYTDNTAINKATDPIYYRVFRRNSITGAFTKIFDVPDPTAGSPGNTWQLIPAGQTVAPATASYYVCEPSWSPGNCIYWDYIPASTNDLTYYVQPKNSCGADLNLGTRTAYWRECNGADAMASISVSPTTINRSGSYAATVNDCAMAGGGLGSVVVNNISSLGGTNFASTIAEDSNNTGLFNGTILTQNTSAADTTGVYTVPTNTANAIVTVSCPLCTGPPTPVTVTVTAQPCDFSPSTPTGLSLTKQTSNPKSIILNWSAPADTDPPSYTIYKKTGAAGTYAAIAVAAAGSTTYMDSFSPTNGVTYYYYIVATDSCPLNSGNSSVANITW